MIDLLIQATQILVNEAGIDPALLDTMTRAAIIDAAEAYTYAAEDFHAAWRDWDSRHPGDSK